MVTTRQYLTEVRYIQLTNNTVSDSAEWERRASIVEELIDDVVGPTSPFHVSRTISVTSATTSTFTSDDLNSDQDDFYNGLRIRIVQGTGKGQETQISDYDADSGLLTVSPVLSTAPDSNSEIILEQVGIFPRQTDRDVDGRPHNPDALERAVAYGISFTESAGGTNGVNSTVFDATGGKSSESIGSYSVSYDSGSVDTQREIGSRSYNILANAGLINNTAIILA